MTPLRFTSQGGQIVDRAAGNRDLPLAEAYSLIGIWSRYALEFDDAGARDMARVFARSARELTIAVACAEDWRACSGDSDARLARLAR